MPRDKLVCVEMTEMEGSPAPAVSSEEPLFRSQDDLTTLQVMVVSTPRTSRLVI